MFKDWRQHWRNGRRAGAALMKVNPKMVAGFQALSAGRTAMERSIRREGS